MNSEKSDEELARSGNLADKIRLAEDTRTAPEILYFLAEDQDESVRHAVARNTAAPRHADIILAGDGSADIRSDLAIKLARITPDLPPDKRQKLYRLTEQALSVLAQDQLSRIREILSNALKDVANAPHSVVQKLACDRALDVAEPMLIFSPVLTEKDLLQIISSDPIQGVLSAIARRKNVSNNLSHIIIKSGDRSAVTYLLNNTGAKISKTDLDQLVDQAKEHIDWHAPLVSRPVLSAKSILKLSSYLAMNLLDKLQDHINMDDETLARIAETVEMRLAETNPKSEPKRLTADEIRARAVAEARKYRRTGALTPALIEDALDQNNHPLVIASISLLADIDHDHVVKTLARQKTREITALVWKAGLSAHMARQIQMQIARIKPQKCLMPTAKGNFALSEKDMADHIAAMPGR